MPAITEKVVKKVYDSLIEYSYNKLGGSLATQQELLNTCEDIKGFCLEGKWDTLSQDYRQAWLGEIFGVSSGSFPRQPRRLWMSRS